jgi:hypothetical protein
VVTVAISIAGARGGESVGGAIALVGDAAMAAKAAASRNRAILPIDGAQDCTWP